MASPSAAGAILHTAADAGETFEAAAAGSELVFCQGAGIGVEADFVGNLYIADVKS